MIGRGFGLFDFAFLFDCLSVLELKSVRGIITDDVVTDFETILVPQLGRDLYQTIKNSNEYLDLYKANVLTFDVVEAVDHGEISEIEVHKINKLRFRAKQALQKRFFGSEMSLEKKSERAK